MKFIFPLLAITSMGMAQQSRPNILVIYTDDMGYGDVQILNPERGKIPTPCMDEIARDGMIFTDAHTTSSVCTPSRYSLLTGRYSWRTTKQYHVLNGYSQALIADETLTVGELLQEAGYKTAMIGKWHLGMNLPTVDGQPHVDIRLPASSTIDWAGTITDGPTERGFDYFFGISASLDMAPYAYMENQAFISQDADNAHPQKPVGEFKAIGVLDEFADRSVQYISEQSSDQPFFLYVPLTSPHTPILPTAEWQGKSGINRYADFQMQTDAIIGRIVKAVDDAGLRDNTLVIISSDNGCSKTADFKTLEAKGHYASAQYRGSKADLWEGGLRVPFLVRWPAAIAAGSTSHQTICQTDLLATFADILEVEVPASGGVDSVSFLPALSGEAIASSRKGIVSHSVSGHFAYRMGDWKLLLAKGSGGWTHPRESELAANTEVPPGQLYNLAADPGETTNLYTQHPEKVEELLAQLKADIYNGRSTAGPPQQNDLPNEDIMLWKGSLTK